jgi:hypothetical protein
VHEDELQARWRGQAVAAGEEDLQARGRAGSGRRRGVRAVRSAGGERATVGQERISGGSAKGVAA